MNRVNEIIPVINITDDMNSRAKLDTGKECNYSCSFCYYINQLDEVTEFDVIKERIDYIHSTGIKEIDLSGGESSIHKDFIKIIEYCTSLGLRVSMLTNGSTFDDIEYLKKAKNAGLKEILFSVQGYGIDHDKAVNKSGAFEKIVKSMNNAKELGLLIRINTVVTALIKQQDNIIQLYKDIEPIEVNFLTLNNFADAGVYYPYRKSTKFIKSAIDAIENLVKYINVRYTPFCQMKGYEKYICGTLQHIYDRYDWNIVAYSAQDMHIEPTEVLTDSRHYTKSIKRKRNQHYTKPPECLKCSHFYICDGIEKGARNIELEPYNGTKIKNINHYRENFYENY